MKFFTPAVVIAALVFAACNPTATTTVPSPSPATEIMEASPEAMMEGEVNTVAVQADDFTYDVEEIRVKQGEKLVVSFTNTEGFHDFVIDELDVNSGMVAVGDTVELEIPTDQPGEYFFYCSVGNHRERGMEGTLIIE